MADDNEDTGSLAGSEVEDGTGPTEDAGEREVTAESRAMKFLTTFHPECRIDYKEDVLLKLPLKNYPPKQDIEKPENGDTNHRSVPFLTNYEKTKVIGFRANQLAQGAYPFVDVPAHVTDVIEIARLELEERKLPFILKRPMPDGSYEYWRLSDLMIL